MTRNIAEDEEGRRLDAAVRVPADRTADVTRDAETGGRGVPGLPERLFLPFSRCRGEALLALRALCGDVPTHVVFYRPATLHRIAEDRGWTCEIPEKDVALLRVRGETPNRTPATRARSIQ